MAKRELIASFYCREYRTPAQAFLCAGAAGHKRLVVRYERGTVANRNLALAFPVIGPARMYCGVSLICAPNPKADQSTKPPLKSFA